MRAILIVAYRRADTLTEILESCISSGIQKIFIHIDGPKNLSAMRDVEKVSQVAHDFSKKALVDVKIAKQQKNIGCAVSLINSIDSVFAFVEELIVLEDDCVPSPDFWKFSVQSFQAMKSDSSIGLFCGAQFAPQSITNSKWFLSRYPFHWGWGINSEKWNEIRGLILCPEVLNSSSDISKSESRYWNAGCSRALRGSTDVWDTLFVRGMLRKKLKSLMPPNNLIRNLGNDEIALHTSGNSIWADFEIGDYQMQTDKPKINANFECWARGSYFKISRRHLVTTRITFILDKIKHKNFQNLLSERIKEASVSFL